MQEFLTRFNCFERLKLHTHCAVLSVLLDFTHCNVTRVNVLVGLLLFSVRKEHACV